MDDCTLQLYDLPMFSEFVRQLNMKSYLLFVEVITSAVVIRREKLVISFSLDNNKR